MELPLEGPGRRLDVSSDGLRSDLDWPSFPVGLAGLSIMMSRIIISIIRIAIATSQVGQYPISSINVPETMGPINSPDIKKTEMVEMVRDVLPASTVSATVEKPTIHAALPAMAWITRPNKSTETISCVSISCVSLMRVRSHDGIPDVAAATSIVPAISPLKESRRGAFREGYLSAQLPIMGPDKKQAKAWIESTAAVFICVLDLSS